MSCQIRWAVNPLTIAASISLRYGSTKLPVGTLAGFKLFPAGTRGRFHRNTQLGDFGDAEYYEDEQLYSGKYLNLSFPHSNLTGVCVIN